MGDEWLTELRELRAGSGEGRRYRARAHEVRRAAWESPATVMLWRLARKGKDADRAVLLLYAETATSGDLPLVALPVQVDAPFGSIRRGDVVEARGIPEPGHAMVIDVDDRTIDCAGPAYLPSVLRRRYRL